MEGSCISKPVLTGLFHACSYRNCLIGNVKQTTAREDHVIMAYGANRSAA